MQDLLKRIDGRVDECIDQLADFVRIPSISAGSDGDSGAAIEQAADFLVEQFACMDFTAQKVQVSADTNPLVLARSPGFSGDRPTVMVYGH